MRLLPASIIALLYLLPGIGATQDIEDYSSTIEQLKEIPAVAPFFESAYGYGIWPRIARGGLGIGAASGKGQIYKDGKVTGFSRLYDVTIGFQAGGQAYKQVVFFEDERAYREFTSGSFQFDASASAVAVTASAQANASAAIAATKTTQNSGRLLPSGSGTRKRTTR